MLIVLWKAGKIRGKYGHEGRKDPAHGKEYNFSTFVNNSG